MKHCGHTYDLFINELREAIKWGLTAEVLESTCDNLNITADQLVAAITQANMEWDI